MTPVGVEPTNVAGERPQTYALDCAATGTGSDIKYIKEIRIIVFSFELKFQLYTDKLHVGLQSQLYMYTSNVENCKMVY
jgi:hypothetical protein